MPRPYDGFPLVRPLPFSFEQFCDGRAWMFEAEVDGIEDFDGFLAAAQQWSVVHRRGFKYARYLPIMKGEPDRVMIQFLTAPAHREGVGCPVYSRCPYCFPGQDRPDSDI